MQRNPIQKYALTGMPLSIARNWPEMYRRPVWIVVYRADGERDYLWSARRETALEAAWKSVRQGKDRVHERLNENYLDYPVSDEATAAALEGFELTR